MEEESGNKNGIEKDYAYTIICSELFKIDKDIIERIDSLHMSRTLKMLVFAVPDIIIEIIFVDFGVSVNIYISVSENKCAETVRFHMTHIGIHVITFNT